MSDDLVDVAALVAPLDGEGGAGTDLRVDYSPNSIYQRLRDARSEARADERARDGSGETDGAVPEAWRQVRRLAAEALQAQSKDFEVAAWLTEALVREAGLEGLVTGVQVMTALLEQHWDAGHPQPDEDGLEGRSLPLGGLAGGDVDGTITPSLRRVPLFRRPGGENFGLYQFEASSDAATLMDEEKREQRYATGVLPLETVETEAKFKRAELRQTAQRALAARAEWQLFQDQLEVRFGNDAPPTRRVAELLERMAAVANRLGGEPEDGALAAAGETSEAAAPGAEGMAAGGMLGAASGGVAMGNVPVGSLANREQALRLLEQLSGFFQKTEPHSFLAYTLSDAARRGRMTLPELLSEVLQDETARHSMLTALGIRPQTLDGQE